MIHRKNSDKWTGLTIGNEHWIVNDKIPQGNFESDLLLLGGLIMLHIMNHSLNLARICFSIFYIGCFSFNW